MRGGRLSGAPPYNNRYYKAKTITGMRVLVTRLLAPPLLAASFLVSGTAAAIVGSSAWAPAAQDPLAPPPMVLAGEEYRELVEAAEDTAGPRTTTVRAEVISRLEEWAAAWSRQDTEAYLGFYDSEFTPSGRLSRSGWEAERDQRLSRPGWITVQLSDIEVQVEAPDRVRVELVQDYRSDGYGDRSRKLLTLVLREGEWRILSETTLKILRQ